MKNRIIQVCLGIYQQVSIYELPHELPNDLRDFQKKGGNIRKISYIGGRRLY